MLGTYSIISPVRNEAKYLPRTITSIVRQKQQPLEWIIVDDGSTDTTAQIAEAAAVQHSWIKVIRRQNRGFRQPGQGVVEAFNEGLAQLENKQPDFLCKMDGDLEFSPDYFVTLLREFVQNPALGMASGATYLQKAGGKIVQEKVAPNFVVGPIKLYRRACFEDIGGLEPHLGWDTIDVYRARMQGWETANYRNLIVLHLRQMGTAKGIVWGKMKTGMGEHYYGSHPLFVLARCLYRMTERPYGIIGLSIALGYLQALVLRKPRIKDPQFIKFLRMEQLSRLQQMFMPWKRRSHRHASALVKSLPQPAEISSSAFTQI
ncbi:glycosyltransferase family 2 protein [candidate division KSB1 bacterium]|nr:glycosyltransferase family 2 protein [candidate division KSB1 bacterium]